MVYYRPHEQRICRGTPQETLDSVLAFVFYSFILICHHILFHTLQFIINPNGRAAITIATLALVVFLFDKSMTIASGILATTEFSWQQHNNAYLSSEEMDIDYEPTAPLTTTVKLLSLLNGVRLLCTASYMALVNNCLYNNTNDDNNDNNSNTPREEMIRGPIEDWLQQDHYMVNNNFQQQLRVKNDLTLGCPQARRQNDTEAQAALLLHGYDRYGDYYLNTTFYQTWFFNFLNETWRGILNNQKWVRYEKNL